jgi:hypothetical protein
MTSATLHPMTSPTTCIGHRVFSSSLHRVAVVQGNESGFKLLVIFNSNLDEVFTFNFSDDLQAWEWHNALTDTDLDDDFSWGKFFNQQLKNGHLIRA